VAAKRRVHEIAKGLGRTSKELLELFKAIGVDIKAANSVVTPDDEAILRAHLFGIKAKGKTRQAAGAPGLVKLSPTKVRLRKKAPPKEEEKPPAEEEVSEGTAGAGEAAAAVEKKPAAKKGQEDERSEAAAAALAPETEQKAKGADEKAPAPPEGKAAPPGEETGDETPAERTATTSAEALRRFAKGDRLARRRAGRGRGRKGPRGALRDEHRKSKTAPPKVREKRKVHFRGEAALGELALLLDVPIEKLETFFQQTGRREVTPLTILTTAEQAAAARELDFEPLVDEREAKLVPRRPVVTVLGHVDHGKTTLLDALRKTNVVASESGGITQHIGASVVPGPQGDIVFIDTPGHEVFTKMRARGAQVTDVVVLVVAVDDGVMPQTLESISHAKAAHVPIVVAITKMDMPSAEPLRVKRGLAEHGVTTEDWGGDVLAAEVSAVKGEGLDKLLEAISTQAEIMELRGDVAARTTGVVIESGLDRGRGAVITVLVQRGMLRVGDAFVVGKWAGRVRAMFDAAGASLEEVNPSEAVTVLGAEGVPAAGDIFLGMPDARAARNLAALLSVEPEKEATVGRPFSLDEWYKQLEEGTKGELQLVVKADVTGSVEALAERLGHLGDDEVSAVVLHAGVGGVNETDVLLADASQAVVVAFRVGVEAKAKKLAQRKGVDIRTYDVIYETLEDIRAALEGLLEPEIITDVVGVVEVRELFELSRGVRIVGGFVRDGRATRDARVRLQRGEEVVYEGSIASLRRFRDDVKEVQQGFECGVQLAGFNDEAVGDIIQVLEERKVARRLGEK